MKQVVIIGGGISGLCAAYDLEQAGAQVTLIESSPMLGGKIGTVHEGPYLLEQGPDSFFSTQPWACELIAELGLDGELISPQSSEFSVLAGGRLHSVPRPLASLMPSASVALEKVGFLGSAAKKRFLKERDVEPGTTNDESIASFFRRRLGRKFSELIAEPLLSGMYAGNPDRLSMSALYPSFVGMVQKHGSLTSAAESARQKPPTASKSPGFLSLRGGMGELPRTLAARLTRTNSILSARATDVRQAGAGLSITLDSGFEIRTDHLILSVPAYAAAKLLGSVSPVCAELLSQLRFISTAVATFAYPRNAFPQGVHGNGFLVPFGEPCDITGCTWSSNKWAGRSPSGEVLLRAFVGREGDEIDDKSDEEVLHAAESAITRILRPGFQPSLRRLDRWPNAMPQYEVGHLEWLERVERSLHGLPIQLIGASYRGVGIPGCVKQGREAAKKVMQLEEIVEEQSDLPRTASAPAWCPAV